MHATQQPCTIITSWQVSSEVHLVSLIKYKIVPESIDSEVLGTIDNMDSTLCLIEAGTSQYFIHPGAHLPLWEPETPSQQHHALPVSAASTLRPPRRIKPNLGGEGALHRPEVVILDKRRIERRGTRWYSTGVSFALGLRWKYQINPTK